MDKIKRIGIVMACCLFNLLAGAQPLANPQEDNNDFMRSNGKIYVVVAVAAVIITGLFIYLLNLEKKIKKLEKDYL